MRAIFIILCLVFVPSYSYAQVKDEPSLESTVHTPQTIKEIYDAIGLTEDDIKTYNKYVETPTLKYRASSGYRDNPAAVLAIFEANDAQRTKYYKAAAMYEQLMQSLEADLFQQTIAAAGLTKNKNIPVTKSFLVPEVCSESCFEQMRLATNYAAIRDVSIYFPGKTDEEIQQLAASAEIPVTLVEQNKIALLRYEPSKNVKAGSWFNE